MLVAQILSLLYNIVDRIYIARIPDIGTTALGAVGLCFPIIVIITAFSNLFGSGGAPLFSIERGKGDHENAYQIMHTSFSMLTLCSILLMLTGLIFAKPILTLFGADRENFGYACPYLMIYLLGTFPSMVATGMNPFINAQGYATTGMISVVIGAVANLILDPIFIFAFGMGIRGAAIATVISQILSAAFVLHFLLCKAEYKVRLLHREEIRASSKYAKNIISLGTAGFIMQLTNSLVTICCNHVLSVTGGTLYISVMTIISSVRQVVETPIYAITEGSSPVISYNYGAGQYLRVRQGIKFLTKIALLYTSIAWCILDFFPEFFIHLFNSEEEMLLLGVPALHIYFLGFFMMAFQSAGQTTFISLGMGKYATFFSLFRKVILVIPLTIFLPNLWDLGVYGVFYAEMISNFVGGIACFSTMMMVVWRRLGKLNK